MRRPRITFDHHDGRGELLSRLLRAYAYTAYPPGGSDCAAVSRETLIGYADSAADGSLAISSRQLPMIKAAINWYCSESSSSPELQTSLIHAFKKESR